MYITGNKVLASYYTPFHDPNSYASYYASQSEQLQSHNIEFQLLWLSIRLPSELRQFDK